MTTEETYDNSEQYEVVGRFSQMLWEATRDGGKKRAAGTKPSWKVDPSHEKAIFSHLAKWKKGELVDADSGSHPLVHCAWRCLAVAYQEMKMVELADKAASGSALGAQQGFDKPSEVFKHSGSYWSPGTRVRVKSNDRWNGYEGTVVSDPFYFDAVAVNFGGADNTGFVPEELEAIAFKPGTRVKVVDPGFKWDGANGRVVFDPLPPNDAYPVAVVVDGFGQLYFKPGELEAVFTPETACSGCEQCSPNSVCCTVPH